MASDEVLSLAAFVCLWFKDERVLPIYNLVASTWLSNFDRYHTIDILSSHVPGPSKVIPNNNMPLLCSLGSFEIEFPVNFLINYLQGMAASFPSRSLCLFLFHLLLICRRIQGMSTLLPFYSLQTPPSRGVGNSGRNPIKLIWASNLVCQATHSSKQIDQEIIIWV